MFVASYQRTMASARPKMRQPEETRVVNLVEERAKRARQARLEEQARLAKARQEYTRLTDKANRHQEQAIKVPCKKRRWHRRTRPLVPGDNGAEPGKMLAMVAAWHGVTIAELRSPDKPKTLVTARFDAFAAVYLNCRVDGRRYTMVELGDVMGKDHSTAIHALRKLGIREAK